MSRNKFWEGETYAIVKAMRGTGNQEGVIARWKKSVEQWALSAVNDPNAVAARAWLPLWQVRPFYTAEELAPIWPALAIVVGGFPGAYSRVPRSAMRLAFELDYAGLPRLGNYPEFGEDLPREYRKYFIVERLHYWCRAPLAEIEKEFENVCS